MSVSFAPNKIDIPEGFASLVNELTMRILAEQPEDIIGFAAFYLRKKLQGTVKDNGIVLCVCVTAICKPPLSLRLFSRLFTFESCKFHQKTLYI